MSRTTQNLLVGLVIAVVTPVAGALAGNSTGPGWAMLLIGVVLSAALWVMLALGEVGHAGRDATVDPRMYALAGALAIALGPVLLGLISPDNSAFWASGFIMAGVLGPAVRHSTVTDDEQ